MKKTSHVKILMMVQFAFLAALEVVLTLLYIPITGPINLNFGLVPIVVSGIVFGPIVGMVMGAVSGIVTMIQVLTGQGVLYVFLVATNPVVAAILCVVKTAAAGLISGLVYNVCSRKNARRKTVSAIIASAACPIVNTGIFALCMLTIFGDALMADPVISTWTTGGLFALVFLGLIGANFLVELVSTVVITPAIFKALRAAKLVK